MKRITTLAAASLVVVLALAGPASAGDSLPQNDCGSGADAGNTLETALPVTTPLRCSASIDYSSGDPTDVFAFTVGEDFRLLSVTITPSTLVSSEVRLITPAGSYRVPPRIRTLCLAAPCSSNYGRAFAYTMQSAGQWKLLIGGDFDTIGGATFLKGSYTLTVRAGGGEDDCAAGRASSPAGPAPLDAPNQTFSLSIMELAEVDCSGSMPFADVDMLDSYAAFVRTGDAVAFNVIPTVGRDPCAAAIAVRRYGPFQVTAGNVCASSIAGATADGTAVYDLGANWSTASPGPDLGYRLLAATSSRHAGDCFTRADAGGLVAAAAMPAAACVGDVGAADREDWYLVDAAAGDSLKFAGSPSWLPYEVYDPAGVSRGRPTSLVADVSGEWLVRVATDLPAQPHFEGSYGVLALRRPGP
jgi:hypothetical protein